MPLGTSWKGLAQAEKVKAEMYGSTPEASPTGNAAVTTTPGRPGKGMLSCPSCGADFRVPPGSGGKKFRCAVCKTVIQAPADL